MACFATPYGLRYAAHCFNRAYAQNNRQALIPAGGKLGVTSELLRENGELIDSGVEEMAADMEKHTRDEIRKSLRKALAGSKHFKLK